MAGISKKTYKTQKGIVIRYVITYRDYLGRQHTYGSFTTKKAAKNELQLFNNNNKNAASEPTIGLILEQYIKRCENKSLAKNTLRNYKRYYEKNLKCFHSIKYSKLDVIEFQNWLFELAQQESAFIADGCFKLWRAAFRYAKKFKQIQYNPFEELEGITLPKGNHNHFETEELLLLLEKCKYNFPDFYPLFFTLATTGMRIGEAMGLLREDINFNKNEIFVHRQYTAKEEKEKPKTDSSIRTIYIFPALAEVLKEHIKKSPPSKFVFCNKKGNVLNLSNIRNRWYIPLLNLCGFSKDYARLHDLRGSNIDFSLTEGLSVKFAQNQHGHADSRTTLNNYAKNNNEMVRKAMEVYQNTFQICEQNVSKKEKEKKTNILQFPTIRSVG